MRRVRIYAGRPLLPHGSDCATFVTSRATALYRMDERRRKALKKHHQGLRTRILVRNFLPALRPVLTDVEYDQVADDPSNIARVDELIRILLTKEKEHFDAFCKALETNGYRRWATTLQEEVGETIGR